MTDDGKDAWLALIGAMLASKDVRKQAISAFTRQDVPASLQPLWDALAIEDGNKVWTAVEPLGLRPGGQGKVLDALIAKLQQDALSQLIATRVRQSGMLSKGQVGADAMADTLEAWAMEIRARQAQIGKQEQGRDKGKGSQEG